MLTQVEVVKALPANLKSAVTQQLVDNINNITTDPLIAEQIRNNYISYTSVMKDGKFKIDDYLNAVAYVSYKLMGYTNQESYFRTFPQRHQALVAKGTSAKDISAYVSAYARGKLVGLIYEQSLIPTWVLNQDVHQKAINTLVTLMDGAMSEKVRCDAATAILTNLAKPKDTNFQISLEVGETSGMNEMRAALADMAQRQQDLINSGVSTKDIAGERIIPAEVIEHGSTQAIP
jgi:hypothetical protein